MEISSSDHERIFQLLEDAGHHLARAGEFTRKICLDDLNMDEAKSKASLTFQHTAIATDQIAYVRDLLTAPRLSQAEIDAYSNRYRGEEPHDDGQE